MTKETRNRCADCGTPTSSFLCDRCAQICDNLTIRGEYWFRRIRPVKRPEKSRELHVKRQPARIR
jgi:hypothetical protein